MGVGALLAVVALVGLADTGDDSSGSGGLSDGDPATGGSGTDASDGPGGPPGARGPTVLESSEPVAPPADSPIELVRRDCGFTVPLEDGHVLWVFCDTTQWDPDGRLRFFVGSTAALSTPEAPTMLRETLDDQGRPMPFVRPERSYPTCDDPFEPSIWPMSGVALPGADGAQRILVYYLNVCLEPGGADTLDMGLAELVYQPGTGLDALPLRAELVEPRLFPEQGEGGTYGLAAVTDDRFVYVYWCEQGEHPCQVARVAHAHVADADAYRFWDGDTWSAAIDDAAPLHLDEPIAGLKPSVAWVDPLDRYVMVNTDAFNQLDVRFATRPQGPWTDRHLYALPGCDAGFPENCFAAEIHAHLSTDDSVAVGYFDPSRPVGAARSTRLVEIPVAR